MDTHPCAAATSARSALVGHTGFVGSNLARQLTVGAHFNSKNIADIEAGSYGTVYCAGAPGTKWLANAEPEADRRAVDQLCTHLGRTSCQRLVLISTVDVYGRPIAVDESHCADATMPYGAHRRHLEDFVRTHFADHLIIRLPALFGLGLKKNALFDLLHADDVSNLDRTAVFQWYDVACLRRDIARATNARLRTVNLTSEPVALGDIASDVVGRPLNNKVVRRTVYDVRSKHAAAFGELDARNYVYRKQEVMQAMAGFVRQARAHKPKPA